MNKRSITNPMMMLAVILLSAFLLASCGSTKKERADIEGIAFKEDGHDKWSFMSPDGKIILEDKLDIKPATPIRNGHFYVQNKKGFYELYKVDGDNCHRVGGQYKSISEFYDGVAIVCGKHGTPSLIDGDGKEIKNLGQIEGKTVRVLTEFNYGYARFATEDGEWGVVNTKGETTPIKKNDKGIMVIEYKGDICFMSADEKQITYYDERGKEIHSINKDERKFGLMKNGYMGFKEYSNGGGEKCGIVDYDGNIIVEGSFEIQSIIAPGKTCFVYKSKTDKFGVKDYKGNDILKAEYDDIAFFDESGTILVVKENGGEYKLFDLTGHQIGSETFMLKDGIYQDSYFLKRIDASHIIVYANGKYNIISSQGEMLHDAPSMQEVADIDHIAGWVPNDKLVDDADILDVLGVSSYDGNIEGFSPCAPTDLVVERLKKEGRAAKKEPSEFGGFEISYFREWLGYKAEYRLYVPYEYSTECIQFVKIYLVDGLENKREKLFNACCEYVESMDHAVLKDEELNEKNFAIESNSASIRIQDDALFYYFIENANE